MKRNGNAERRRRENRGAEGEDEAPRSSATGARIEAPKAPRGEGVGVGVGRGCPLPTGGGAAPPIFF